MAHLPTAVFGAFPRRQTPRGYWLIDRHSASSAVSPDEKVVVVANIYGCQYLRWTTTVRSP